MAASGIFEKSTAVEISQFSALTSGREFFGALTSQLTVPDPSTVSERICMARSVPFTCVEPVTVPVSGAAIPDDTKTTMRKQLIAKVFQCNNFNLITIHLILTFAYTTAPLTEGGRAA